MDWKGLTIGLSTTGIISGSYDDRVVQQCVRVKLSFSSDPFGQIILISILIMFSLLREQKRTGGGAFLRKKKNGIKKPYRTYENLSVN